MSNIALDALRAGCLTGTAYAVVAVGMQAFYLPTRSVNFAQGDIMVLGAVATAVGARAVPSIDPACLLLGWTIVAGALSWLAGAGLHAIAARNGSERTTLALIGAALVVHTLSEALGGGENFRVELTRFEIPRVFTVLSPEASEQEGLALVLVAVVLGATSVVDRHTRWFERLHGYGSSRTAFQLWELDESVAVRGAQASVFLGLVGGALLAPITYADPYISLGLGVHGFGVLVLARHHLLLAVALSIAWGVLEQAVGATVGRSAADLFTFLVVSLACLVRVGSVSPVDALRAIRNGTLSRVFSRRILAERQRLEGR